MVSLKEKVMNEVLAEELSVVFDFEDVIKVIEKNLEGFEAEDEFWVKSGDKGSWLSNMASIVSDLLVDEHKNGGIITSYEFETHSFGSYGMIIIACNLYNGDVELKSYIRGWR